MPPKVYFDTVSFRVIGKALENAVLPDDIRDKVLVSPLSAFEVLSQLTIGKADEVLHQIQAIHNWINPKKAGLLPWSDDALTQIGFGKTMREDDFTQGMEKAFNACLNATAVEPLQEEAGKLKDKMDSIKFKTAQDFGRLLDAARKEAPKGEWFSEAWFQGVAKRAKVHPSSKPLAEVVAKLSAYHEFERTKLLTALGAGAYVPEKHQNDLFDAEQLIYLGCPDLCFLTCDKGFGRVNKSPQAAQITVVAPEELSDVHKVEAVLRKMMTEAVAPAVSVREGCDDARRLGAVES
jgi:hypothetical protein